MYGGDYFTCEGGPNWANLGVDAFAGYGGSWPLYTFGMRHGGGGATSGTPTGNGNYAFGDGHAKNIDTNHTCTRTPGGTYCECLDHMYCTDRKWFQDGSY